MDDDAGRLVDDQQIVILIYRIDRDILRRKIAFFFRQIHGDDVSGSGNESDSPGSAVR